MTTHPPSGEPTSMADEPKLQELDKLIAKGKEKGFLTYDEVNDALTSDIVSLLRPICRIGTLDALKRTMIGG